MEPVNYDSGTLLPAPGYLQAVRELTRKYAVVLIFDEILSGFRTGAACAQGYYGVVPDLTCLGKPLGGGTALSAFGGSREVMSTVAPPGGAVHSGTFNAHLIPIMAAQAFLAEIQRPDFYPRLEELQGFSTRPSARYSPEPAYGYGSRRSGDASACCLGSRRSRRRTAGQRSGTAESAGVSLAPRSKKACTSISPGITGSVRSTRELTSSWRWKESTVRRAGSSRARNRPAMRIAIGQFQEESNTFVKQPADVAFFARNTLLFGDDVLRKLRGTRAEMGGFIDVLEQSGVEIVPSTLRTACLRASYHAPPSTS